MSTSQSRIPLVFFSVILLIVAFQAFRDTSMPINPPAPSRPAMTDSGIPCQGTPIKVDYAYDGSTVGPNECLKQCQTQQTGYILYSNGLATQCQPLPGCNDTGEDEGVTCSLVSTMKSSAK